MARYPANHYTEHLKKPFKNILYYLLGLKFWLYRRENIDAKLAGIYCAILARYSNILYPAE